MDYEKLNRGLCVAIRNLLEDISKNECQQIHGFQT